MRALLVALLLVSASHAEALTVLTTGKRAMIDADRSVFRVGADPQLGTLVDPTACPSAVTVRIAFYPTAQNLIVGPEPVALPCAGWKRVRGGWRWRGDSGGITMVRYTTRGLAITAQAPGFVPVAGPMGFVQVTLDVDDTRYHVRFHSFRRNDATAVVARRTSSLAGRAEAAFWDTLFGDARRDEEALRLLARAGRRDPRDGRMPFLEAMTRLYRFGDAVTRYPDATPAQQTEITAARAAFARALPLLYEGGAGDTRALGFASGTTYVASVLGGDPALRAQAVEEMRVAAELNPLFNAFNPIGVVPPAVAPTDPAYADTLRLLDEYFPVAAQQCFSSGVQGEICFNDGLAPHNLEGTFVFFGDVYAKAGRIDEARSRYQTALATAASNGWNATFVAEVQDRLDDLDGRVARFQDDDPTNDPPMLGVANRGCAHCHYR